MGRTSLEIIRKEHASLASLLHAMREWLEQGIQEDRKKFFDALRAMLFYIGEFPERLHHPKESNVLFPMVSKAAPELDSVIERLNQEHTLTREEVHRLQNLLLAWELLGDSRREAFVVPLNRYIQLYLVHMMLEEQKILPAAERHLSEAQWQELDDWFEGNRDPLTGLYPPLKEQEALFEYIEQLVPEFKLKRA